MERESPIVSIIVPTYNRAEVLGRALQSLAMQTFRDFEILLIDDGSTDGTKTAVDMFLEQNPTIPLFYIRLDRNRGAAYARNEGVRRARGSFIAFQDSDDRWHPEKLEKQILHFRRVSEKIGVVYCALLRIGAEKEYMVPDRTIPVKEGDVMKVLVQGNFIPLPAAVVRKECFTIAGLFDEDLPCLQDWELWLRIAQTYHFHYLDETLVFSYFSSDSICLHSHNLTVALQHILKKHVKIFSRTDLARIYKYLAYLYCTCGNMQGCRRYLLNAVKTTPADLDALYLFVLSCFRPEAYRRHTRSLYSL